MTSSDEILKGRAADASDSDRLVLSILHRRPSRATAIQKLGLLVDSVVRGKVPEGFAAHHFGGFNDDIDTSLTDLQEEGYVYEKDDGNFALTPAGETLLGKYLTDQKAGDVKKVADMIVPRMAHLSDREILAIAYEAFPALTEKSLIKASIEKVRRVKNVEIATIPR